MHLHFVGIGGIGISGLAQLCVHRGHTVSGTDLSHTEGIDLLKAAGIQAHVGSHGVEYIPQNTDRVIYSEAIPPSNPERVWAREHDVPEQSYFELLGEISAEYTTIAVAGTHGKTTTVGLLAAGMISAGLHPTVLMGAANSLFSGGNVHLGGDTFLVVEACEYRENFRFLHPSVVLLTNAEWDHTDAFPTETSYFEAMKRFTQRAPVLITHPDEPGTEVVAAAHRGTVQKVEQDLLPPFRLSLAGDYNRANAKLALALMQRQEWPQESFIEGMCAYTGGSRRQEYKGEVQGIHVYDDYGHHPTEIRLTIEAIKSLHPGAELHLIFEPHQHARTKAFFADFFPAFAGAKRTALHPIYAARDTDEDKQFTIDQFFSVDETLKKVANLQDAQAFAKEISSGDILLFMGAGVIDQLADAFVGQ